MIPEIGRGRGEGGYLNNTSISPQARSVPQTRARFISRQKSTASGDATLPNTILNAGTGYGIMNLVMATARKITVEIPGELLDKAQQASGTGITQTVRTGLQLLAASQAYDRLLQLRGKVRFSRTFEELKEDRE
jgi:hypothetical protein